MLAAVDYQDARAKLLRAAAWNTFVSRRGLNASEGRAKRRENQLAMAALRQMRVLPPVESPPIVELTVAHSMSDRVAGRVWRQTLKDIDGPGMRAAWREMPHELRRGLESAGYDANRLHRYVLGQVKGMRDRGLGSTIAGVTVLVERLAVRVAV